MTCVGMGRRALELDAPAESAESAVLVEAGSSVTVTVTGLELMAGLDVMEPLVYCRYANSVSGATRQAWAVIKGPLG